MDTSADNEPRLYYGWIIAFTAMIMLIVSQGMSLTGPTVFDEFLIDELSANKALQRINERYATDLTQADVTDLAPGKAVSLSTETARELLTARGVSYADADVAALLDESAVSVGQLKVRDLLTLFTGGIFALFAGALVDRLGPRRLLLTGFTLLAAAYWYYGRVNSLGDVYLVHILLGVVISLCGMLVNVILVARWFVENRGTAIGIALAGTSLGNAFAPPLNGWLLDFGTWREVFTWVALLPLLMLPLVALLVRDRPSQSSSNTSARAATAAGEEGMELGQALRSRNFWMLALLAMCTFYSILGAATHTFLFMRDEGYSLMAASSGSTILFIGGLVGKLISGKLAERFGRKQVLLTSLVLMLMGIGLMLATTLLHQQPLLMGGLTLFGFGWGGIYTLIQLLSADLFGLRSLGKIMGCLTVLDTFGGGLGPFLTGTIYDVTGNYTVPFMVIAVLLCLALVSASLIRIPARRVVAASPG